MYRFKEFAAAEQGFVAAFRYFFAIILLIGVAILLGTKTGFSDAWGYSTAILFAVVFIASVVFSLPVNERNDDSSITIRWFMRAFLVLGAVCAVVQGFFFLPLLYALIGMVLIPGMWFLVPYAYPKLIVESEPMEVM